MLYVSDLFDCRLNPKESKGNFSCRINNFVMRLSSTDQTVVDKYIAF